LVFVWEYEKVRSRKALLERYATVFFNAVRESDQIAKDYAKGSLDGRYNQNIYRARRTPRPRINAHIGRL